MYLGRDECKSCSNRNDCPYQTAYSISLAQLSVLLEEYRDSIEWYGCLSATCDYFVEDYAEALHHTECYDEK